MFMQRRHNVFDVGSTLYKCYANVLFLLCLSRVLRVWLIRQMNDGEESLKKTWIIADGMDEHI